MVASAIGLAILGIIALLIAGAARIDTRSGIWLTITVLPAVGLTFGVLSMIALFIVSAIRRTRAARDAG